LIESRTTGDSGAYFPISRSTFNRTPNAPYQLFQSNPTHPGLQFKKLEGQDNIYSARIGLDYRALAVMKKDRVVWYWIGSHSDYDRLV